MIFEMIAITAILNKIPGGEEMKTFKPAEQIICETGTLTVTPGDIDLLERVVMSEAGNQCIEAQEAVATVVLNRWLCTSKFGDTIPDVIYAANQFSTHDNGDPTVSVQTAVHNAIVYHGTPCQIIPSDVYYFRSWTYHSFGEPYCNFDDMYFSR